MVSNKTTSAPPTAVLHSDTEVALAFVKSLAAAGFYGTVSLKLERGRITHIRQEENFKPSELSGVPRQVSSEATRSTHQQW
jgi:hypothetical protein